MADELDLNSLFASMGAPTPPTRAVLVDGTAASDYGSTGNEILGLSRSLLAGPTFGLSKNVEAGLSSLFSNKTYAQELADINAQQRAYTAERPVVSTVAEGGMGYALNPLAALGNLTQGAKIAASIPVIGRTAAPLMTAADEVIRVVPGARIAQQLASSVPAQGFLTGYASADPTISDPLYEGLKSAAIGTAGSVVANLVGGGLSRLATESDRLMLGSFGITAADLGQSIKKASKMGAAVTDSANIPIAKTVKALNSSGVINAGEQVLDNISSIVQHQKSLSDMLSGELVELDAVATPFRGFQSTATNKFVNSLAGVAQDAAKKAVKVERAAIRKQMKDGGTFEDLQKAKIGLNYAWDSMASTRDVQRALRSDLRQEIEDRATRLAKKGLIDSSVSGNIINSNKAWGAAAEVKDLFANKAAKDLGSDVVEDAFMQIRTTGGSGSLNIVSAASGNPIPAVVGQLMNASRTAKGKQFLSQALEDPLAQQLGAKLGDLLQAYGTGRTAAIIGKNIEQPRAETAAKNSALTNMMLLQSAAPAAAAPTQAITPENLAQALKLLGVVGGTPTKQPISYGQGDVKQQILEQPTLIQAIISTESRGNPKATSGAGAKGLMQLMPGTASDLGVADSFDPGENIRGGSDYVNAQIKKYGDRSIALAAYNWGPGNIDKSIARLEAKSRKVTWDNILKYTSVPVETRNYVQKVRSNEGRIRSDPAKYWDSILNKSKA
jgi:soluble lytic murein transglycosylase-like protein